jgi:hypothetical protein
MARAEIEGIGIDYELIGDGRAISIIPGGRFSNCEQRARRPHVLCDRLAMSSRYRTIVGCLAEQLELYCRILAA